MDTLRENVSLCRNILCLLDFSFKISTKGQNFPNDNWINSVTPCLSSSFLPTSHSLTVVSLPPSLLPRFFSSFLTLTRSLFSLPSLLVTPLPFQSNSPSALSLPHFLPPFYFSLPSFFLWVSSSLFLSPYLSSFFLFLLPFFLSFFLSSSSAVYLYEKESISMR